MEAKQLREYAKINAQIKELEGKRDQLKVDIVSAMVKEKIEKAETDYGVFTRAVRTNWVYSSKVDELKEKVKLQEAREQNKGIAKSTQTEFLRFSV